MSTVKRYYNPEILTDKAVPDDTRYLTSMALKKSSYSKINNIMVSMPEIYTSKGRVVDAALSYFAKHLSGIKG